ncbi:MAG TPA: 16S rRNA (cytidine(1402)-2'-O)-methyltransferase [Candidatus Binatia bacterium]|nr:16S rRNA (cytidine(1402)-2'-O)-methyltransferase [Candidatus Binatia bacterium]
MAGVLYIVATPIGNLEDITLRALRVLKEVDLIAAEDTRHTRILLDHYDIRIPLTSYHEHNERAKAQPLIARLLGGESIALVSDAGTPAISDPGYRLIVEAISAGIRVIPLPGASALAAALSASGLPSDRFAFEGFLPTKKQERKTKLQELRQDYRTLIFYEAPHRLSESLQDMLQILGDRQIAVGRELSKIHEEFLRGTVSEVMARLADHEVKGEVTVVVRGSTDSQISTDLLETEVRRLIDEGMRVKEISDLVGARYQISKREIYQMVLKLKGEKKS